ncbi:MAG: DUF1492 domain-containing protein [Candidatus Fimivivens sp.]|nr:DUF1492 domain-containing protein [Candidatus Fimivivens sp.]
MTKKDYDEKRLQLGKYRLLMAKLERRTEETRRWENIAYGCSAVAYDSAKPGRSSVRSGTENGTALDMVNQLKKESEDISSKASVLRMRLQSCIDQLPDNRHRDVLEAMYINGYQTTTLVSKLDRSPKTVGRLLRKATEELAALTDYFNN